jgi:hypothetical protein
LYKYISQSRKSSDSKEAEELNAKRKQKMERSSGGDESIDTTTTDENE